MRLSIGGPLTLYMMSVMILIMMNIINEGASMQTPLPTVLITGASTGIGAVLVPSATRFVGPAAPAGLRKRCQLRWIDVVMY